MTDISASASAARESARRSSGEFGVQEHSAPELTLADSKQKVVDDILTARFGKLSQTGLALGDGLDLDDVRDLMLAAIAQHQAENPAIIVIDGNGDAVNSEGVDVIDLDYLGEFFDDGNSRDFHVQRATEDLDRLRAAGLDKQRAGWQVREHIADNIEADWIHDVDELTIGGRYGDYLIEESATSDEATLRDFTTGEVVATFPTFAEAKTAAETA